MRNRRMLTWFVAVAVWGILGSASDARAATLFVDLSDATVFSPNVLFANVGDTVTWRYTSGSTAHNVVSDPGVSPSFRSGDPAAGGGAPWPFSVTFNAPGTVRFHCEPHGGPNGFGMSGVIYVGNANLHSIGAWELQAVDSTTVFAESLIDAGSRVVIAGSRALRGNVSLPTGSQVVGLQVVGCDRSGSDISVNLRECVGGGGACTTIATVNSFGSVATPACGAFSSADQTLAHTVQNAANAYLLEIALPTENLHLRQVRVAYRKQVSPAPAAATFADVPTNHVFFQFVEAVVAAGITSGCGGSNYCPDSNVTRGQLAVFLARALGLNWPN